MTFAMERISAWLVNIISSYTFYTFCDRLEHPDLRFELINFGGVPADFTFVNGSSSQVCITPIAFKDKLMAF